MMCCDLSAEVTECLHIETDEKENDPCRRCPMVEKVSGKAPCKQTLEVLEQIEIEEYEETLI